MSTRSVTSGVTPRRRSHLVGPLACACAGVVALGVLAWGPSTADGVPCPLHAATGWWCPACGATRGVRELLDGDVPAALGHNLLLPMAIVTIAGAWWAWMRRALGRAPAAWTHRLSSLPPATWVLLGVTVAAFTVLRNTTWGAALAP